MMTTDAGAARDSMDIHEKDMASLKKRRRQEIALRIGSGAIVSVASFVTSYVIFKSTVWSDQSELDTYPFALAAAATQHKLRGTVLLLLVLGIISAVAGAVAGIILGEPEPSSAVRYNVWTKDD